jgi:hypothetical protein
VVEQKGALRGLFRQKTALQCSHSETTTFLYCDFKFYAPLLRISVAWVPSSKQNDSQPLW